MGPQSSVMFVLLAAELRVLLNESRSLTSQRLVSLPATWPEIQGFFNCA